MGPGEYSAELPDTSPPGHLGWQCGIRIPLLHRRFPDLVTQRLLKSAFDGEKPPYSIDELGQLFISPARRMMQTRWSMNRRLLCY
jgi:exoribonuclease-2